MDMHRYRYYEELYQKAAAAATREEALAILREVERLELCERVYSKRQQDDECENTEWAKQSSEDVLECHCIPAENVS